MEVSSNAGAKLVSKPEVEERSRRTARCAGDDAAGPDDDARARDPCDGGSGPSPTSSGRIKAGCSRPVPSRDI